MGEPSRKHVVELVAVDTLTLDPANARKHPERNLEAIKGSLARFGQQKPIVVSKDGVVVAGNGTLAAARVLGWEKVSVVRTALTGTDLTAFALADNRTAELAEWDDTVLGATLHSLREIDFDLGSIGFDTTYLDSLNPTFEPGSPDDQGRLDEKKKVSCPGCGHVFTP